MHFLHKLQELLDANNEDIGFDSLFPLQLVDICFLLGGVNLVVGHLNFCSKKYPLPYTTMEKIDEFLKLKLEIRNAALFGGSLVICI